MDEPNRTTTESDILEPPAGGSPERRTTTRRRTNGVRHYHHHHHRRRLVYGLGVAVGVLFLLLMVTLLRLSLYAKDLNDLTLLQIRQERELVQLRPQIAKLEGEIAELVQGRLPGLFPLAFDKVIPVEKGYVRNILFTQIGKEADRSYEFKITLKNGDLTAVHPIVRVTFFDHLGVQVASSVIGVDDEGLPTLDVLERGEVRSFTKVIDLPERKHARYFTIETELPEYQRLAQ